MRVNNLNGWNYNESLNTMLFFAQRMDELLFHHSTDSYRYPVLSIIGLCDEYLEVYKDVEKGIINEKNLTHISDELVYILKEDTVAIKLLSTEFKERFVKGVGTWRKQQTFEHVLFIKRKLGGRKYYSKVVDLLRNLITNNSEKRLVDRYAAILIRLLIDEGYDENYIFKSLHDVFFHETVDSTDSFDKFIDKFTFSLKKFDVYIGYSNNLSQLVPLFQKMNLEDVIISSVDLSNLPEGLVANKQKTILKFENIQGLDVYSAYGFVQTLSRFIVDAYGFYFHLKNGIREYGHVMDENGQIIPINTPDLLKHRVTSLSHQESQANADGLLSVLFSSFRNMDDFSRITSIHNSAVRSDDVSDSLLSLWSIVETVCDNQEGDNIGKVKKVLIPFLKSTYIEKLVTTCMMDIKRWDRDFFNEMITECACSSDLEATLAFLTLNETEDLRKKLYSKTEMFPLLRNRVYNLNAQLKNSKGYASLIESHQKRIEWQIHRIYRARNYIIHDGRRTEGRYNELLINLHSYIDIMINKIIDLRIKSPYSDSIKDIVVEHQLKTSIMDEMLVNAEKRDMSKGELRYYLFYDYECLEV